jgi:small-conductance mechanosensitive channel
MVGRAAVLSAAILLIGSGGVAAQGQAAAPAPTTITSALSAERAGEPSTLVLYNRPIVVFRASVVGRSPAERAAGASRLLHELIDEHVTSPVESRRLDGSTIVSVGSRGVLLITAADIDDLSGETLDAVTAQAVAHLRQALDEASEARAPVVLIRSSGIALAAIAALVLILWTIGRAQRRITAPLLAAAERKITKAGIAPLDALHSSRLLEFQRYIITFAFRLIDLLFIYAFGTFVLRQFPYTRPWGESMRGYLWSVVEALGSKALRAIPGLFTVVLILGLTRFITRVAAVWFSAVERGDVRARWIHPEIAQPTRRLITALLWIFAVVVAYPYMPGSETEAFKGISVFLGLMVTFGSSGLVNHIMSGFMITYSRALRIGDFVRIGDVEGIVTSVGVLSTKVKTLRREEVTIPNAVVVSNTTTDYSRFGDTEGVLTPTSVTIGYDAPWRQVHAMLLAAAERTPGLRSTPAPVVMQTSLEDFYVKYTLLVSLERQQSRAPTLGALHANIQDLFNEHGVQIMSPHYEGDPAAAKIVAADHWFAPPARRETPAAQYAGTTHSTASSIAASGGARPAE